jgi:hypothetical protein
MSGKEIMMGHQQALQCRFIARYRLCHKSVLPRLV